MNEERYDVSLPREGGFQAFISKQKIWLNILLFIITSISTFFVGLTWSVSFKYADSLTQDIDFSLVTSILQDPQVIFLSMIYSVVLLGILLSHELGHFLTCRYYNVDATLPFFIPAPTLIGTMGAFIKIKSPITRKKQLFDIGIAGPIAGFLLSVPALAYGLHLSKVVPAVPREGSIIFGEPIILKIIGSMLFKNIPEHVDIILHPVAFAGWVGILVTALNLFPIGQLDGGHIFYAVLGKRSRKFSVLFIAVFVIMGVIFWMGWLIWAVLIYFLGLKHPRIVDEDIPLSQGRKILGLAILIVFILSFIPDPIKGYSLIDVLKTSIF